MACEAQSSGMLCEEMVSEICQSLGYDVRCAPAKHSLFDLVVNGVRLQVKKRTTRATRPNRIEMKTSKRGERFAYTTADVDAFAILCDGIWLVFPAAAVADGLGRIPNDLDVRSVLQFVNGWRVLEGGTCWLDRQLNFGF